MPTCERPRERLINYGVSNLSNIEILSIILKTGISGMNVKDVSTYLLSKYSLFDLANVSVYELERLPGIGRVKAIEVVSCIELGRRIFLAKKDKLLQYHNAYEIWEDSKYLFYGKKQEEFYCLYFDNKQKLIERKLLFMGTINQSVTHPREVFKEAYKLSASTIVCMHNHPSGDVRPSKADIMFTDSLVKIGLVQGIPVVDHIIFGEDDYYSFYDNKNIINL